MRSFTLLYLRDNVLVCAKQVAHPYVLKAIEGAAGLDADITVQVWSAKRRVAVVRLAKGTGIRPRDLRKLATS